MGTGLPESRKPMPRQSARCATRPPRPPCPPVPRVVRGGVRREMEELHGTIKTDFRALKLQSLNSINPAGHVHPEARL